MRFKLLISAVLPMIFVAGAALAWHSNSKVQQPEQRTVKVVVTQLPAEDNVIPVEIIQATAMLSAPNVLDDVTYVLKNNSGKSISAVVVTKRVLFRENGKLLATLAHSTVDFAFHPDMVNSKAFAAANAQIPMEAAGPTTFEDGVIIESVKLKIEYIQYVVANSYGSGTEGERQIMSQREGAKKYKEFLRKKYSEAGSNAHLV